MGQDRDSVSNSVSRRYRHIWIPALTPTSEGWAWLAIVSAADNVGVGGTRPRSNHPTNIPNDMARCAPSSASPATAWMHANVAEGGHGSMHAVVGKPYDPLRRVRGVLHDWNATAL